MTRVQRTRGGVKTAVLLWLIGAPLAAILLGFAFC